MRSPAQCWLLSPVLPLSAAPKPPGPSPGALLLRYAILVPMEHDASYKLLFSHARMVEDLLRGFVHEAWVRDVDFTTLERVSDSQISDDLRSRRDDLVWRVRWGARLALSLSAAGIPIHRGPLHGRACSGLRGPAVPGVDPGRATATVRASYPRWCLLCSTMAVGAGQPRRPSRV